MSIMMPSRSRSRSQRKLWQLLSDSLLFRCCGCWCWCWRRGRAGRGARGRQGRGGARGQKSHKEQLCHKSQGTRLSQGRKRRIFVNVSSHKYCDDNMDLHPEQGGTILCCVRGFLERTHFLLPWDFRWVQKQSQKRKYNLLDHKEWFYKEISRWAFSYISPKNEQCSFTSNCNKGINILFIFPFPS